MKSSTLRCSFGSIHWSGLKVPLVPSPRGIWPAIWLAMSATSNLPMALTPLSDASSRRHVGSTPQPSGVTMPSPVTTTRLMIGAPGGGRCGLRRNQVYRFGARPHQTVRAYARLPCVCGCSGRGSLEQRTGSARSALGVLLKELNGVADGQNRFSGVVGNLAVEFLLERHHEFDSVEAVGAEIFDEARVLGDFVGIDAEIVDDDFLHPVRNVAHRSNLILQRDPFH